MDVIAGRVLHFEVQAGALERMRASEGLVHLDAETRCLGRGPATIAGWWPLDSNGGLNLLTASEQGR